MRERKSQLLIEIPQATKQIMEGLCRAQKTPLGLTRRVQGMLLLHQGNTLLDAAKGAGLAERHLRKWAKRFKQDGLAGLYDQGRPGRPPSFFLPEVVIHTDKMACELPDQHSCSLSQWDCQRLADQLVKEVIVSAISRETVRRILADHQLKPWRYQLWLSPKVPRDAAFIQTVRVLVALYTRELKEWEMMLCVDEKTSLQPRPRLAPSQKMVSGQPLRLEHEYKRVGALNLFAAAAFDTRSGKVYGYTAARKRQAEFIIFLKQLDKAIESKITRVYIVLDNAKMHKDQQVRVWLTNHPRFIFVHPPVHCSWINQVEQWFSILQRKRFRVINFKNLEELAERLEGFIREWNEKAHLFKWTREAGARLIVRYEYKPELLAGATKSGTQMIKEK